MKIFTLLVYKISSGSFLHYSYVITKTWFIYFMSFCWKIWSVKSEFILCLKWPLLTLKTVHLSEKNEPTYLFSTSKQASHTRTSRSMPYLGIIELFEEHLLQNTCPQFRQWCWKPKKILCLHFTENDASLRQLMHKRTITLQENDNRNL